MDFSFAASSSTLDSLILPRWMELTGSVAIKNIQIDQEWKHVDYTKNCKSKISINTSKLTSPISPNLQHILDNPPTLHMNTINLSFVYESTTSQSQLSIDLNVPKSMIDNNTHSNKNITDNINYEINSTKPDNSSSNLTDLLIPHTFTYIEPNIQQHSKCFLANYNGSSDLQIQALEPACGTH